MIIVMHPDATADEVGRVVSTLRSAGADVSISTEAGRTVVSGSVDSVLMGEAPWADFPGVERVTPGLGAGRRVGRESSSQDTVVEVGAARIGGETVIVVAGPCAVETRDQMLATARAVREAGASMLRGDAYKPRTSPYSFQGLGKAGLEILAEARELTGLPFVAEVLDPRDVDLVAGYADMLRVGTRNMANYALLKEVGRQDRPVMLKRGRAASVEEWVDAAEYVHNEGNPQIVLVERGVRGFGNMARNTLDLTAVPVVKAITHLPVMVDPSHAAGRRDIVPALARAAVAVGADGVLVDVHHDPDAALVDGAQALFPSQFATLVMDVRRIAEAVGRV